MKKARDGAARRWSEEKSFYMVLLLCAAAVVTAIYVLFTVPGETKSDPLDGYVYEPEESITASDTLERVPAMDTEQQDEPADEPEQQPETETAEAVQTVKPMQFVLPTQGELSRAYSGDTLEYDETTRDWRTHTGADYAGQAGDAVCAITDGTVTEIGEDAVWGKYIILSHAQGMTSRYAGLDNITVSEGDSITGGTQMAELGSASPLEETQGVHLHLEVQQDGAHIDPSGLF